jgi:hypothetical protein
MKNMLIYQKDYEHLRNLKKNNDLHNTFATRVGDDVRIKLVTNPLRAQSWAEKEEWDYIVSGELPFDPALGRAYPTAYLGFIEGFRNTNRNAEICFSERTVNGMLRGLYAFSSYDLLITIRGSLRSFSSRMNIARQEADNIEKLLKKIMYEDEEEIMKARSLLRPPSSEFIIKTCPKLQNRFLEGLNELKIGYYVLN